MAAIAAFFEWLGASALGKLVLGFIWGRLVALYEKYKAQMKKDKAIDQKTHDQAEAVKKAETEDEMEKAAKEIFTRK